MEHLRNILGHPKRKFTYCERVYISVMTIALSCKITLSILLRLAGCIKSKYDNAIPRWIFVIRIYEKTGCPTSERQPGGKVFGVTRNVLSNSKHTLLLPFSAVTEKPSGNPKDTLRLSRESNNPPANGLEFVLIFRLSKHRFPMPKLPKEERIRLAMQVWILFENAGQKTDFHFPEMQTIASIRCQYMPITVKIRFRPIKKCYFEQTPPRLFTNAKNLWFTKTMMDRSEHSEILFYTGLQQHSSYDALVYCFAVALSYWFTTAKHQIKVSAVECGFRGAEFGWCKSVAQCILLSMWRYTNVKRQIKIKTS